MIDKINRYGTDLSNTTTSRQFSDSDLNRVRTEKRNLRPLVDGDRNNKCFNVSARHSQESEECIRTLFHRKHFEIRRTFASSGELKRLFICAFIFSRTKYLFQFSHTIAKWKESIQKNTRATNKSMWFISLIAAIIN